MDRIWSGRDIVQVDAIASEAEYVEAEVVDAKCYGRRRAARFIRPMAIFLTAVFAVAMLVAFVGGGVLFTMVGAAHNLLSHGGEAAPANGALTACGELTPAGTSSIGADGMKLRVTGTIVKPAGGSQMQPLLEVGVEVQNMSRERIILRKTQFTAYDDRGNKVVPCDQVISRGGNAPFYILTSICLDRGESAELILSFYEVCRPDRLVYEPSAQASDEKRPSLFFEISRKPQLVTA